MLTAQVFRLLAPARADGFVKVVPVPRTHKELADVVTCGNVVRRNDVLTENATVPRESRAFHRIPDEVCVVHPDSSLGLRMVHASRLSRFPVYVVVPQLVPPITTMVDTERVYVYETNTDITGTLGEAESPGMTGILGYLR